MKRRDRTVEYLKKRGCIEIPRKSKKYRTFRPPAERTLKTIIEFKTENTTWRLWPESYQLFLYFKNDLPYPVNSDSLFFIGKKGALRVGKNINQSKSLTKHITTLL